MGSEIEDWVSSYVIGRKHNVCVNGNASTLEEVTNGISQGGVLGPVLFVLYINDLPGVVKNEVYLLLTTPRSIMTQQTPPTWTAYRKTSTISRSGWITGSGQYEGQRANMKLTMYYYIHVLNLAIHSYTNKIYMTQSQVTKNHSIPHTLMGECIGPQVGAIHLIGAL